MKDTTFIRRYKNLIARCIEPESMRALIHSGWGISLGAAALLVVVMWGIAASITLTVFSNLASIASQTVTPVHVSFDATQLENIRTRIEALKSASSSAFVPFRDPSQ